MFSKRFSLWHSYSVQIFYCIRAMMYQGSRIVRKNSVSVTILMTSTTILSNCFVLYTLDREKRFQRLVEFLFAMPMQRLLFVKILKVCLLSFFYLSNVQMTVKSAHSFSSILIDLVRSDQNFNRNTNNFCHWYGFSDSLIWNYIS